MGYKNKTLGQLNKKLVKRGITVAKTKAIAITRLKTYEKNKDIAVPKIIGPAIYNTNIIVPTANLNYRDITKPFYGVPMDVLYKHVFPRLNFIQLRALALSCKIFYKPLMELALNLFLRSLRYFCLEYVKIKSYSLNLVKKYSAFFDAREGLTPLLMSYAIHHEVLTSNGNIIEENYPVGMFNDRYHPKIHLMYNILRRVKNYGTLERFVAKRNAQTINGKLEAVQVNKRVRKLNSATVKAGYYTIVSGKKITRKSGGFKCILNGLGINIRLGKDTLVASTSDYDQSDTKNPYKNGPLLLSGEAKIALFNYLRHGKNFDWSKLKDYLEVLARQPKYMLTHD